MPAVVCAIQESMSGLELSSVITEPRTEAETATSTLLAVFLPATNVLPTGLRRHGPDPQHRRLHLISASTAGPYIPPTAGTKKKNEMVRQSDWKHELKKRKKRSWLSSLGHGRSVQLLVSSSVAKTAADGHIISILKTRHQEAGTVQ